MMLPGKIENWVVISDFEKNGFGNLGLGSIKQIMNVLTDNFRCRLGVNYIVNPAKSVFYIWSCVKLFLDEVTIDKVKLLNSSIPTELFTHINPYQVEEKYGGKAPNLVQYWPPHVPNAPYTLYGTPVMQKFKEASSNSEKSNESEINDNKAEDTDLKENKLEFSQKEIIVDQENKFQNFYEYNQDKLSEDNIGGKNKNNESFKNFEENIIDTEEESKKINEKNQRNTEEENEKKQRKKQRKIKKEKRRLKAELRDKINTNELELKKDTQNVDDTDANSRQSENNLVGETDKIDIGCTLCSSLSIKSSSNNCIIQ